MSSRFWHTLQLNVQVTMGKLKKEVRDLDGLRFMMNMLKEVRQRESGINMEINPIMNMYQVRTCNGIEACLHKVISKVLRRKTLAIYGRKKGEETETRGHRV